MTKNQKTVINQIIKELISITLNYSNETSEKASLSSLYDIYEKSNCNITKSFYAEVNNLIDQHIGNVLGEREKRQQIQEYVVEVSEAIANTSDNSSFKALITYLGGYIEAHISTYSSMLDSIEDTINIQDKYNNQILDAKRQLIETRDTINNLLPNILTVLSILISIVIAVVIVYITVFLEPDNRTNPLIDEFIQVRFAQYVLSVHVVGDLFFLMMFMIARLTNRTILMTCSHFDWKTKIPDEYKDSYTTEFHRFACADCSVDCSFAKKLQRKSAYILYFNAVMIVLYFVLYIWWLFERYITNYDVENKFLKSGDFWVLIIIAAVSVLFLGVKFIPLIIIQFKKYIIIKKLQKINSNVQFNFYSDKELCSYSNSVVFYNYLSQKNNYALEQLKAKLKEYNYETSIEYKWDKKKDKYVLYYAFEPLTKD